MSIGRHIKSLLRWILTKRGLAFAGIAAVLIWLTFFDSHSLYRRYVWHREYNRLMEENIRLKQEILSLQHELERDLTAEMVERIAREQYFMRRPNETVYLVDPSE